MAGHTALPAPDNQSRFGKNAQMLHDPVPGHAESLGELPEAAPVALPEKVEQPPPGPIGESFEHPLIIHAAHHFKIVTF